MMTDPALLLPDGLVARAATIHDLDASLAFFNECDRPMAGRDWHSPTDMRWMWTHPDFDLPADTVLVEDRAGRIVAYEQAWVPAPAIEHRVWGRVHPDLEERGIGTALLEWAQRTAASRLHRAPDGARVTIHTWCFSNHEPSRRLLGDQGFAVTRHSLHMRIDLELAPPRAPRWPEGMRPERFDPSRLRELYDAWADAFRDHWGHVEQDPEQGLTRFQHWIDQGEVNLDLWHVVRDGDEIAGLCLCRDRSDEDADMAWVDDLAVRRPWRRRGVATALLHHCFELFRERGKRAVGLGVDAESLTGATRLYEKVGMRAYRCFESRIKELRGGHDLATRSIS